MTYRAQTHIDQDLLLDFFLTFSKFEYALKAVGFIQEDGGRVKPDWDCFASTLRDDFHKGSNPKLLQACECILHDPPRKQIMVGGALAWETQARRSSESEIQFVLRMVRSIRNNLFHGGKHNVSLHETNERVEGLLRCCVVILQECLRLSPKVKRRFDEGSI